MIGAFEFQRHPSASKVLRFQPGRHFLAQHFQFGFQRGSASKVLEEGGLAGDALDVALWRYGTRVDTGRKIANGACPPTQNAGQLFGRRGDQIIAARKAGSL